MSENSLSVVEPSTTDRMRSLWRNCRLSEQAKNFLKFLLDKNINGEVYSKPLSKDPFEPLDDFPHETKRVNGEPLVFYRKGISLIEYISQNKASFPNHCLYIGGLTGELSTHNHALRNSLNRTMLRLLSWGLSGRFYRPSMYGARHYYFITEKGKNVLKAKCCLAATQHLAQVSQEV